MARINIGRVFLGGLAGGAVVLAGDALMAVAIPTLIRSGIMPATHLGPPSLASALTYVVAVLLVGGPAAIWFYAAIRPRFGPGPKTAIYVGVWNWLILGPYLQTTMSAMGLLNNVFSLGGWVLLDVIALPLIVVAMLAGAAVYKEEDTGAAATAAGH